MERVDKDQQRMVVTIDGPAGSGKSTVAKLLARKMGFDYLDTGAIYRAVAHMAIKRGLSLNDEAALLSLCQTLELKFIDRNGELAVLCASEDITAAIRTPEVSLAASQLAAYPAVRRELLPLQRSLAGSKGLVAEGRDMGTVVFPEAAFKFFLQANLDERTRRRLDELVARGHAVDYLTLKESIILRDRQDEKRETAPLIPAPDAVIIDTTHITIEEVVERIIRDITS